MSNDGIIDIEVSNIINDQNKATSSDTRHATIRKKKRKHASLPALVLVTTFWFVYKEEKKVGLFTRISMGGGNTSRICTNAGDVFFLDM